MFDQVIGCGLYNWVRMPGYGRVGSAHALADFGQIWMKFFVQIRMTG